MMIETSRLLITDFTPDMAQAVHLGSLDADTARFLPDEVFPTADDALETLQFLIGCYGGSEGPFVHPFLLKDGTYAGYVQLIPLDNGWEVGYHTIAGCTGKGYATEALRAFLPAIATAYGVTSVDGVCDAENVASVRVLEKCGFQHVFSGPALYQGSMRPVIRMHADLT